MTMLVTGAAGFVGRAVVRRLASAVGDQRMRLSDRVLCPVPDARFSAIAADLGEPGAAAAALDGVTTVIHLAALPGGASEADPAASRRVNIDATLALLEAIDHAQRPVRFVYASSIAVFGDLATAVDDATPVSPAMVYGTHKVMAELALADFARRGSVHGVALRLPGLVARPPGANGLKSAFMSDLFHAARTRAAITVPVGPEATVWLMSAGRAADNLVHAASLEGLHGQALTLPALRTSIDTLVAALFGPDIGLVAYARDAALQRQFGALPPLATPAATALGFADDGDLGQLIARVERDLALAT